jgi:hypothetical protein
LTPKLGAPTSHVSHLVRLLAREAGEVEEVSEVLSVLGTDRGGREEHDQTRNLLVHTGRERAWKGGLVLVRRRSGQLKVGPTCDEARVAEGEIDEEALALPSGKVAVPG